MKPDGQADPNEPDNDSKKSRRSQSCYPTCHDKTQYRSRKQPNDF
jgi:hypothetical protein